MVRNRRLLQVTVLLWAVSQVLADPGRAQTSTAAILTLEPSVRASGMGRASTAVFWGGNPNDVANPGLLGYNQGVRLTHGKAHANERTRITAQRAD